MGRTGCKEDKKKLRPHESLYIACAELDFTWYTQEVNAIIELWRDGTPLWEIADAVNRTQEEVAILIIDLAMNGRVEKRKGGVFGGKGPEADP